MIYYFKNEIGLILFYPLIFIHFNSNNTKNIVTYKNKLMYGS